MAEITSSDFAKLVEAQKETTRQLMTAEERAADDAKKAEQFRVRSEAAKKGHETRLANQEQNTATKLSDEEQSQQEESTGFLGKIANFMGMDRLRGAAEAEEADKQESRDSKMMGYLKSTSEFLGGIAKQGMEKVKSGLSGFKKFAFGALAVAALAFLNSPKFEEIKSKILDVVIPALAKLYDKVIKPLAIAIGEKLGKLFNDILAMIDGEKSILSVLGENKLAIAGIITALAPGLVFGALKLAATGMVAAIKFLASKGAIGAITAKFVTLKLFFAKTILPAITTGLAAIKTFFTATLMPFFASAAVPIAVIVGVTAGILLAIYSLKQGFDDFMFELEATGSVWEAAKTGIISVISNLFGFPLDLIKSGVSFILEKIGSIFGLDSFIDASKAMDDFSFVDFFKDSLTSMGDYIAGLFDAAINFLKEKGRKILKFVGLDKLSVRIFGTKEEDDAKKIAKEEEKRQLEEQRIALREQKRLEEKEKEAARIAEAKKKEAAMMVTRTAPAATKLDTRDYDPRRLDRTSIINAPTNVSAPATTNVTQMSKTLAPKDRVMDELGFAI